MSDVARGLEELEQEVLDLKEAEKGLNGRISAVEKRAAESERVLREEVLLLLT